MGRHVRQFRPAASGVDSSLAVGRERSATQHLRWVPYDWRVLDPIAKKPRSGQIVWGSVVTAFLLGGCVGSGSKAANSTDGAVPGTTVATSGAIDAMSAPTVPPAVAVATTQAPLPKGLDTIEATSQNLWDAWRDDDRARALLYATPDAVEALFLTKWGPEVRNQGCGSIEGVARCVYTLRRSARVVVMSKTTGGYFAQRIESVGDLPTSNRLQSEIVDDTVVFDISPNESGTGGGGGSVLGTDSSGIGLDSNQIGANPSDVATAPTVAGSAGSESPGASTASTRRQRSKTTKDKRKPKTTASANESPADSPVEQAPSPAPDPAPSPVPAAGPVPVGGRTVDTVAP